jgi:hypothetical protein
VTSGRLSNDELRDLILSNTDGATTFSPAAAQRLGHGYLNVQKAVDAAERLVRRTAKRPIHSPAPAFAGSQPHSNNSRDAGMYSERGGLSTLDTRTFLDSQIVASSQSAIRPATQGSDFKAVTIEHSPAVESPQEWERTMPSSSVSTVNLAAAAADRSEGPERELLNELLEMVGRMPPRYSARSLYRSLMQGTREVPAGTEVLAFPGQRLEVALRAGDLMVRVAPGEPGRGHFYLLADGQVLSRQEASERQIVTEPGLSGRYARVIEHDPRADRENDRFARLLTDWTGLVPPGQILLRLNPLGEAGSAEEESPAPLPNLRGKDVLKFARVMQVSPYLALRSRPDRSAPEVSQLKFNDRVFVARKLDDPPGWSLVVTDDGKYGYVWDIWLFVDLPEPNAFLHKIVPGESPIGIAEKYFRNAVAWGHDYRFYVNVLVYVNRSDDDKRRGIYKNNKDDSWKTTHTRAGVYIWVPSVKFADSLRGKVPSGSITYETWRKFVEAVEAAWDWVTFGAAFVAGLVHGALESVWDALTGIVDLAKLIGSLVETIIKGELIPNARELWNALSLEKVRDALDGWIVDLDRKWNHPFSLKRGHFRGWVIGYIVAEVVMAVFSAGAITAVKWGGRLGRLAKLLKSIKPLSRIIDKAENLAKHGKGKLDDLRRALKSERAKSVSKANAELVARKLKGKYDAGPWDEIARRSDTEVHPEVWKAGLDPNSSIFHMVGP